MKQVTTSGALCFTEDGDLDWERMFAMSKENDEEDSKI